QNQVGLGITNRLYHIGDHDTFFAFPQNNAININVGSESDRRVNITDSRVRFENLSTGVDINADLDVDGHTNLDNVSIAGVTTFTGNIGGTATFTGDIDVDGHTNLDNVSIAGVTSVANLTSGRVVTVGTGGKLEDSANLTFDGNNLFVRGINIIGGGATSVLGSDIVTRNFKATGLSTFVGNVQFDSGIKAGGSTGNNGEYLQSTGSG
ncbi:MAG: hypothetical protein VXY93_18295, partial [Pseudomonadota bacterium]|nr:hypothetical protein [Pseudomonadota bacterium]